MQGKKFVLILVAFMVIATVVITLLMTQSERFDDQGQKKAQTINPANIVKITVAVEGMTCTACEPTIHMMVNKVPGIVSVKASYGASNTVVEYDQTQTNTAEIIKAIADTGYKPISYEDATGKHLVAQTHETPQKQDKAMKCGAGKCGAAMKCGGN